MTKKKGIPLKFTFKSDFFERNFESLQREVAHGLADPKLLRAINSELRNCALDGMKDESQRQSDIAKLPRKARANNAAKALVILHMKRARADGKTFNNFISGLQNNTFDDIDVRLEGDKYIFEKNYPEQGENPIWSATYLTLKQSTWGKSGKEDKE